MWQLMVMFLKWLFRAIVERTTTTPSATRTSSPVSFMKGSLALKRRKVLFRKTSRP